MQGGYKAATVGGAGTKSAPRANNTVASNGSTNNINSNTNGSNANKKTNAKKKPAANDKGKTVNGSDANDNGAARAAPPPPGFAAAVKGLLSSSAPAPAPSAPVLSPAGFSDSQQRLLRHRALFAFRFLVGKAVDVALVDGSRFVGILDCIDPDDFSLVLKNTQRKDSTHESEPFDSGSTVIFKRRQIAHIAADGVVNYTEGPAVAAAAVAAANAPGFRTDTEISGRSHEHLYGRELESATSWLDPQLDSGELEDTAARRRMSGKGAWNQFEVNEKLFGVVSSYDENLYTTKLDKTKISNEKSREAERLAREIERETTGNFHLQEERGQAVQGDDDLDEEAKYSSVDRKQQQSAQAARNPNAYVPPALRSASRPSSASAAPNKAVSVKAPTPAPTPTVAAVPTATAATAASVVDVSVAAASATASALAASPPAAPAVVSTAAASLPRKPISFSEAVTGRPAARPSPTLTPAGAPTTTAAAATKAAPAKPDSKSTSASPKKQPSPKSGKPHAGKAVSPGATKKDTKTEKKASQSTEKKTADTKSVEENKTDKKSQPAKTSEAAAAPATTAASEKKTLNPNAREFKLSAKAVEFKPTFATPPMAPAVVSSPYRQPNGGHYGHMHHPLPPHPVAMGYAPSPEEWMYDANLMLDETEYAQAAAAHAYMGYAMPMMPNAAMMQQPPMYAPMMPPHQQQNVRMGRGGAATGGGYGGGYGHAQPGMYNNQRGGGGYYGQGGSVPGAMPYHPVAAGGGAPGVPSVPGVPGVPGVSGVPQPPLPREPSPADAEASSLEAAPVSNSTPTILVVIQKRFHQCGGQQQSTVPFGFRFGIWESGVYITLITLDTTVAARTKAMMLPPIHKQPNAASGINGSSSEAVKRRGSSSPFTGDPADANRFERVETNGRSASEGVSSGATSSYLSERMQMLERENDHFRHELLHLRQVLTSNNHQRDDEQMTLSKVSEELQRLVHAFNAKAQADGLFQQREQQKAALLFAELTRLSHSVETVDHAVRSVSDDTRRKLELHDQQLSQLATASSVSGGGMYRSSNSPTKLSLQESHRQSEELQWLKHALSQLRTELESDRSERWRVESERSQWAADLRAAVSKTDATMDARIASHLERVHSKLMADKMEMLRALDEYRELLTGADFKRMSSQLVEFTRVNDHLLALERWIHTEHGKIKRVLQATQTESDDRLQAIAIECGATLRLWSGVLQQQDDDWRTQFASLQQAVAEMAQHVQRKVFALEEVVPMEVRARQTHDEKLRRRVDSAVQSLSRAIERATAVPRGSRSDDTLVVKLQSRVAVMEQKQTQLVLEMQQTHAMLQETLRQQHEAEISAASSKIMDLASSSSVGTNTNTKPNNDEELQESSCGSSSSASAIVLPRSDERDHPSGDNPQTAVVVAAQWHEQMDTRLSELSLALLGELSERHNELLAKIETLETQETDHSDAIASLRRWTITHAQECRQCYEYFQWTLQQSQTDTAVRETLASIVDYVVESCMAVGMTMACK